MADATIPDPPWHRGEPTLIIGALTAVITAAAPFLHVDLGVVAGINAAVAAVAAVFLRTQVVPTSSGNTQSAP